MHMVHRCGSGWGWARPGARWGSRSTSPSDSSETATPSTAETSTPSAAEAATPEVHPLASPTWLSRPRTARKEDFEGLLRPKDGLEYDGPFRLDPDGFGLGQKGRTAGTGTGTGVERAEGGQEGAKTEADGRVGGDFFFLVLAALVAGGVGAWCVGLGAAPGRDLSSGDVRVRRDAPSPSTSLLCAQVGQARGRARGGGGVPGGRGGGDSELAGRSAATEEGYSRTRGSQGVRDWLSCAFRRARTPHPSHSGPQDSLRFGTRPLRSRGHRSSRTPPAPSRTPATP